MNIKEVDSIGEMVSSMKKEGYNFATNGANFTWELEQHPDLQFILLIKQKDVTRDFDVFQEDLDLIRSSILH